MIGSNIRDNRDQFKFAFDNLKDDIAVHTWSHPYMTTLTNEQVVAELGYTVQIIRDLTGGRLPRYWRPPFGDSDQRVRAIALEVFGLITVIWNQEYVNVL
jgi:chitin deacetylase